MRVVIVGAGAVGTSIARELCARRHEVCVIEHRHEIAERADLCSAAVLVGDAADLSVLRRAELDRADVLVCATGDDRANLVVSLLGRSEFGVGRTVARVNNPRNHWLFGEAWGVDVAVSTPSIMTALVEEAVETGDLVRLLDIGSGEAALSEYTVPRDHWTVGRRIGSISWPDEAPLVAVVRDGRPRTPQADEVLQAGDEVFFLSSTDSEATLRDLLVDPVDGRS
ncbi:potassium channel family protein [Micrococcus lylae]|uniref:Trk system potassium uptake protein TrkA n=1 Tax=Micrococcus lylae TaxID=1273 RepID=A0ABY2K030_9MICC|nr:TrkA family potassium uptake protein [Micrococcus lylae]TFH99737.1 TrkA family potassium uptake protein [Micrococcus lylae]